MKYALDISSEVPVLQALFERLLGLPIPQRQAMIEEIAQMQPDMASELATLIEASASSDSIRAMIRFDDAILAEHPRACAFEDGDVVTTPVGQGIVVRLLSSTHRIGHSEVYEVLLDAGHRRVALKVLRAEVSAGELGRRFRVEAHTHAMLDHPGIASLLGAGACRGTAGVTHPAIVTALVEGETFDEWVSGNRTVREIALGVSEIARSVHFANIRGIVHRDLKPQNIIVDRDGRLRILDLGVAKLTESAEAHASQSLMSVSETVVGTPRYMAPEQFTPTTRRVDLLADVYALGCILYESLTGHPPVEVEGLSMVETADAKRNARVCETRVQGVPRDLVRCAARACAPLPADRYESCQAFAIDIERALNGLPMFLQPPTPTRRFWLLAKRRPLFSTLTLLAVLMTLSSAAIYVRLQQQVRQERDRAVARFDESRSFANWVLFDLDRMLSTMPGTAEMRQRLIDRASESLDALTEDPQGDDALLLEIVDARLRLADVLSLELGNQAHGDDQLQRGLRLLDQLSRPDSPDAQVRRAWIKLYRTYTTPVPYGATLEAINFEAIRIFDEFESQIGEHAPYWRWRADAEWKGTRRLLDRNADATEVLTLARAAIAHADRAVALDPHDPFNQSEAANTRFWLAHAMVDLGDPGAMRGIEHAIAAAQTLADANHREGVSLVARGLNLRGNLLAGTGQIDEAISTMLASINLHERAVRNEPGNKSIYRRAEICHVQLASLCLISAQLGNSASIEQGLYHIGIAIEHLLHRIAVGWFQELEGDYRSEYARLEQDFLDLAAGRSFVSP